MRRLRASLMVWVPGVALLLALTLPHLDQGDFRTDTAWYSAIALQAARTGEWWTLGAEPGEPYFNKPPLVFWMHAPLLWAAGPRLWAARLPTVMAAAGCVALTALIARVGLGRVAAASAGCVLALTLEFFRRTREISLDMWQVLFLLMMVWMAARGVMSGRRWLIVAAGVPLGLALMCKPGQGLLGVVALGVWMVVVTRARRDPGRQHGGSTGFAGEPSPQAPPSGPGSRRPELALAALVGMALVGVAVAAPWHVSMVMQHGDAFVSKYFGAEMGARARGDLTGLAVKAQPPWFYLEQIGTTYWPWLVVVVLGAAAWARARLGESRRGWSVLVLGCVWAGVWLVCLSAFPDRRDRYALVLWPGLALVCGAVFGSSGARGVRPVVAGAVMWAPAAACVLGVALAVAPLRLNRPIEPQWTALYEWMRERDVKELWRGGIAGNGSARLYLEFGRWPRPARGAGEGTGVGDSPGRGALLLYHRRGGRAPGAGEVVVFSNGDLTVTRLDGTAWMPVEVADPGE